MLLAGGTESPTVDCSPPLKSGVQAVYRSTSFNERNHFSKRITREYLD